MKSLINSFFIAVSMYSTIPVPFCEWNEKNMKNAMCFFPFISIFCSIGIFAVWKLCIIFNTGSFLFGVLAVLINVIITGGIHIDGFCDTADALFSRRSQEEKLRILKDSSCGSFAVLGIILVLMVLCASYSHMYEKISLMPCIMPVFAISRSLSGISIVKFKYAPSSSLAKTFSSGAGKNSAVILISELILSYAILFLINYKIASAVVIISLLVFLWYRKMSEKEFGGITGDLAGFFLVVCETLCILCISVIGGVLV